jgi:hypothetical protein
MIQRLLPVLCVVLWVLDAALPAMARQAVLLNLGMSYRRIPALS